MQAVVSDSDLFSGQPLALMAHICILNISLCISFLWGKVRICIPLLPYSDMATLRAASAATRS